MYKICSELTIEDFVSMEKLEKLYYGDEFITPYATSYECYLRFKHYVVAVKHNEDLVGMMCLFPVTDAIFLALKTGDYNDATLTPADIVIPDSSGKSLNLFLSCIVIHEAHRKGVKKLLFERYKQIYFDYEMDQNPLSDIITDNVSEEGVLFSKRHCMTPIKTSSHSSVICMGNAHAFLNSACH